MRTIKQGNKYISKAPKSTKAVIYCFIVRGPAATRSNNKDKIKNRVEGVIAHCCSNEFDIWIEDGR